MDSQRQYIPPPPPISQPIQSHIISLPPPPPRNPPAPAYGSVLPPPPGPPPAAGYGTWQNWGRQPLTTSFPPPPSRPILPSSQPQHQPLGPNRQPAPLSIPSSLNADKPYTGPTYVPNGVSFGPGVGIPALFDSFGFDAYSQPGGNDGLWSAGNLGYGEGSIQKNASIPSTPSTRTGGPHELIPELSPNHPAISSSIPQPPSAGHNGEMAKTPSHRNAGGTLPRMLPGDAAMQWPLERVISWLSKNGFSKDWQETFKALELQGADFLELGHGSKGRGNLEKIYHVVYPQLESECERSGTGWDLTREREEGLRIRKLIRQIHENGNSDTWSATIKRRDSQTTDGGLDSSPLPWHDPTSNPNIGSMESNSAQHPAHRGLAPPHNTKNNIYAVAAPVTSKAEPMSGDIPPDQMLHMRFDYSRNVLGRLEDNRRKSPSAQSENGHIRSYDASPQSASPATQHAASSHPLSSSSMGDLHCKYEHSRDNSADSVTVPGRVSSAIPRYYESRKQAQDNNRPGTQDSVIRPGAGENSTYPKDHNRGLWSLWKKKSKSNDPTQTSEDLGQESPTSPVYPRQINSPLSFPKPGNERDRPPSPSTLDHDKTPSRARITSKANNYIFVTLDGLNYRLVDATDTDSGDHLRSIICQNLMIGDFSTAQIFSTEPGKTEHEDPLDDTTLIRITLERSDYFSLFLVRCAPSPRSANVSIPDKSTTSSTAGDHRVQRKPLEEGPLKVIPVSPSHRSRRPKSKPASANLTPSDSSWLLPDNNTEDSPTTPEAVDLVARQEEYEREVKRKKAAYIQSKKPSSVQPKKDTYNSETGYKRGEVIDFDSPRDSPFDDKKSDILVPLRKAPSAPTESNTLSKVNSLRRSGDRNRVQPAKIVESNRYRTGDFIAEEPVNDVQVKASLPFGHDFAEPALNIEDKTTEDSSNPTGVPSHRSPSMVNAPRGWRHDIEFDKELGGIPSTTNAGSAKSRRVSQSQKPYGPEYDFNETKVSFQQPLLPRADPDEDSDDGLFVVPLRNQSQGKQAVAESPETLQESKKPSLKVNTETRSRKGQSVSFISPSSTDEDLTGPFAPDSSSESGGASGSHSGPGRIAGPIGTGDSSSQSYKKDSRLKRNSFAQNDLWASRPPVEGVIDNLDDFFPGIDLDQTYVEAPAGSPPSSPVTAPSKDKQASHLPAAQLGRGSTDTLGSDESTLKNTVAQRNINRSSMPTRMKSIREIAKGTHQIHRNKSVVSTSSAKSGEIIRRKSTKMFGAKIMQISPKPGSRISQLDPIPQNSIPQDNIPKRPPTFRIICGQLIGKGTFGKVYLGINADNGEVIAVKQVEINAKAAGQDKDRIKEMVAAINQEIDTMQHLEHPNIVQYLGCERGELSISIYLEYISGGSVGSCLRKHGKFEESVVKSLTRQTLSGLAYLHDQGILHRDLKADNILLDLDGTCKISDFGISKKTDNIYGNDSTNSMQGSVFWMAPEVVQSQGQGYSAKVDIWSLGCVVLEMFAGRRPWSTEEPIGAIFKLGSLGQAPPIPDDVAMNISPVALAFMYDCFTVDTFDRPTAGTLLSHPFCKLDESYDFLDTELYAKIRHVL